MTIKKEVHRSYKRMGNELTNMLFDKGFLADDLSRESIQWLEDYLGYILQSHCEMAEKGALLVKSLRGARVPRTGDTNDEEQ